MESRWRQHVALGGYTYTNWRLIARLLGAMPFTWVSQRIEDDGSQTVLLSESLDLPKEDQWFVAAVNMDLHFPYGLVVEPDHPV